MILFFSLVLVAIGSFFVGSIPVGVLVGKRFFAKDIRADGSGNIGAANALRSFGALGGAVVLVLDVLKGLLPTLLEQQISGASVAATAALFAVLGHCFTPWLGWRGGKGVATWLGGLLALSWIGALVFGVAWIAIVAKTRYASLGSIVASSLSAIVVGIVYRGHPVVAICAILAIAVVILRHRENLVRLRAGTERKLAFGRTPAAS